MLIHLKDTYCSLVFLTEDVARIVPILDEDGQLDAYLMYLKNMQPAELLTIEQFDKLVPFLGATSIGQGFTDEIPESKPTSVAQPPIEINDDLDSAYLPTFIHSLALDI